MKRAQVKGLSRRPGRPMDSPDHLKLLALLSSTLLVIVALIGLFIAWSELQMSNGTALVI